MRALFFVWPKCSHRCGSLTKSPTRVCTRQESIDVNLYENEMALDWNRALLNRGGGGQNGGHATFVWQERAQTRATQMTHMPSLKPLFCCIEIKARCVIGASFACHREKCTPHLGPPHLKVPDLKQCRTLASFRSVLLSSRSQRNQVVGMLVPVCFSVHLPKSLDLQSWRPFKEGPKPRTGKVPRRVLQKVPVPKRGAEKSAEKCALGALAYITSTEARNLDGRKRAFKNSATGKYGRTEVQVYPEKCGEQLGRDPSTLGSSESLVLKDFWGGGGTHWESSLLVSLTLWDTPVLFTPPLALPPKNLKGHARVETRV